MNYQLITTDAGLQQVCEQARKHAQIALDTEFVRTRTYYPQLGLIQLYDGEQLSLMILCRSSNGSRLSTCWPTPPW